MLGSNQNKKIVGVVCNEENAIRYRDFNFNYHKAYGNGSTETAGGDADLSGYADRGSRSGEPV